MYIIVTKFPISCFKANLGIPTSCKCQIRFLYISLTSLQSMPSFLCTQAHIDSVLFLLHFCSFLKHLPDNFSRIEVIRAVCDKNFLSLMLKAVYVIVVGMKWFIVFRYKERNARQWLLMGQQLVVLCICRCTVSEQ